MEESFCRRTRPRVRRLPAQRTQPGQRSLAARNGGLRGRLEPLPLRDERHRNLHDHPAMVELNTSSHIQTTRCMKPKTIALLSAMFALAAIFAYLLQDAIASEGSDQITYQGKLTDAS